MQYRILRDKGLPDDAPIYQHGEIVESEDTRFAEWEKKGFAERLAPTDEILVSDLKPRKNKKPAAADPAED